MADKDPNDVCLMNVSHWTGLSLTCQCSGLPLMQMSRDILCVLMAKATKCAQMKLDGWFLSKQLKQSSNAKTEVRLLCKICKTQRANFNVRGCCDSRSGWCQNSSLSAGFTELLSTLMNQKNWRQLENFVGCCENSWEHVAANAQTAVCFYTIICNSLFRFTFSK